MLFARSADLRERASTIIPDHTQTAAKAPRRFVQGCSPVFLERAEGAFVWDVDGNRFLDFTMALCPVILGYCDRRVDNAVKAQIDNGILFTLPHALEVEVSEELLNHWTPWARYVRFFKTGSEAMSAAVRLARAATGREHLLVVKPGYHGWHDWFIASQQPSLGICSGTKNDISTIDRLDLDQLRTALHSHPRGPAAALVLEPLGMEPARDAGDFGGCISDRAREYLHAARRLCNETKTFLIFDEVVTGIRTNPTVAKWVGIEPDLMALAKAVANGYAQAALVGNESMRVLNQDEVYVSGTYSGDLVGLSASKATLQILRSAEHGYPLEQIFEWGRRYLAMVQGLLCARMSVIGTPVRFVIQFQDRAMGDYWQQECIKRGVLFTSNHTMALAHCNQANFDLLHDVYKEISAKVHDLHSGNQSFADLLEGEPTVPAFANLARSATLTR